MLDVARRHLAAIEGAAPWELHEADARALPVGDYWADIAIAGWVFGHFREWMPDNWQAQVSRALGEMRRALRPGGALIVIETLGTGRENRPHRPPAWTNTSRGSNARMASSATRSAPTTSSRTSSRPPRSQASSSVTILPRSCAARAGHASPSARASGRSRHDHEREIARRADVSPGTSPRSCRRRSDRGRGAARTSTSRRRRRPRPCVSRRSP